MFAGLAHDVPIGLAAVFLLAFLALWFGGAAAWVGLAHRPGVGYVGYALAAMTAYPPILKVTNLALRLCGFAVAEKGWFEAVQALGPWHAAALNVMSWTVVASIMLATAGICWWVAVEDEDQDDDDGDDEEDEADAPHVVPTPWPTTTMRVQG